MTHLTSELVDRADEAAIAHLETCEQCRLLIVTDVELGVTRSRVMERVAATVTTTVRADRRRPPWVMVAAAAGLVLALFAPLLLLSPDREPDFAGDTEVSLPGRSESEPPPPPVPTNDLGSYEMVFTIDDGRQGRLIWDSPTFYEGLVTTQDKSEGPTHDYGFYRTGTDWGFSDNEVLEPGAEQPDIRRLPDDPAIPWSALINMTSVEETWSWMGAGEGDLATVAPTHPLASRAWSGGGYRLETAENIPVLIERPGHPAFRVNQLTHREIRAGEIGNNTDLPFLYALYLVDRTTDEQRQILEDGLVTFADYEGAATEAAECAGIEPEFSESASMFVFSEDRTASDCVARFVDDIAEVWRVDSQFLDGDEFVALWYTIEGRPKYAAMHRVEPGPERALASGGGWAISIAQRGEGYCTFSRAENTNTEGCELPEDMPVPGILKADVTTEYEGEDQLLGASVVGIVTARADRVVIIWGSGEETSIAPGEIVEFGFRGFGMISRGDGRGEPVAVQAYSGDRLLGTQMP